MKDQLKNLIRAEIDRLNGCTQEDSEIPRSRLVSLTQAEFSLDRLLDFLNEEEPERGPLAEGREHLTEAGEFRSDKYPDTPDGILPLKITDKMAWPMLRAYAAARVGKDIEFTRDLDEALDKAGAPSMSDFLARGEDDDASPSAIADMMTALVGTLDQMEDVLGRPAANERQFRRREIEDEVLRLSRKVQ